MIAVTARMIEIRARILAGGITRGFESRRIAQRATRFVKDVAKAEELTLLLASTLDYHAMLATMSGDMPGCCELALEILNEIETASR
jgi:hypothetical protein